MHMCISTRVYKIDIQSEPVNNTTDITGVAKLGWAEISSHEEQNSRIMTPLCFGFNYLSKVIYSCGRNMTTYTNVIFQDGAVMLKLNSSLNLMGRATSWFEVDSDSCPSVFDTQLSVASSMSSDKGEGWTCHSLSCFVTVALCIGSPPVHCCSCSL